MPATTETPQKLSLDFWKFWAGQAISALGDSFTGFALPLLVFKLTGSAVNLALSTAAYMLPYLLFGLVIGAWTDRVDRKRLMISVDAARALIIATIPLSYLLFDSVSVVWIYGVLFANSTLNIAFDSADFAAIPSLVQQSNLVTANGRITASYSTARIVGPLLAGVLLVLIPIPELIFIDALSFVVSAVTLASIGRSFNATREKPKTKLRQDVAEGLRYVWGHPVLRNISIMMALVNFVAATVNSQGVLFAIRRLGASDAQVGWLYSAGGAGVVLLSLLAGQLRKKWSFSRVALGALMANGLLIALLALTTQYYLALPIWALMSGVGILFNINTRSLRQAIVPNHMLGRVISIAGVLAWSAIPLGAFLGGAIIEATGDVASVFLGVGVLTFLIPVFFAFTPLGRAEQYMPDEAEAEQPLEALPQEVIAEGEAEEKIEVTA